MASIAYLELDQGSDFTAEFTLQNDDDSPMDLRFCEVYSQFRKSYGSTTGYTFACSVVDQLNGIISISLSGTASSSIKPGRYLYDVEIYNSSTNKKFRAVEGIVTINPEITRIP